MIIEYQIEKTTTIKQGDGLFSLVDGREGCL
jgi:hypothetical protein